jgi:carboxyl-terminal processing protease
MTAFRKGLLAVVVIGAAALTGGVAGQATQKEFAGSDKFLSRYAALLRLVMENSPQPVSPSDLVYSSIDGMLALLDPHTNFLRPENFAHMREHQEGAFHGIGVIISLRGGRITVITPVEGSPAARLGLRAGDVIETVDGASTEGMDIDEAARRLRGPEGTKVRITVSRLGLAAPLDLTIERARVSSESVRYALKIDKDTAYIRVNDFIRSTGDEVRRSLERLQKEGATRLVLDLRDNPGGIVDTAVATASVLLDPGQEVFSTKGRTADSFQDYRVPQDGLHFTGPLVVLVNRGSASAAEIVAGAIQDHDRGILVGETSFGKGVVQTIYPVRDSGLALTTAKYYTPSGRCIQRDFDSFFDYIHVRNDGEGKDAQPQPKGPVFLTDSGRKVFGGGGITPDHEVHIREYSERMARLVGNSAFFQFAIANLADKPDKAAAARSFAVTDDVIKAFRTRVINEKWLPAADIDAALADANDRQEIEATLRFEILNAGVSLNAGYRAILETDEQVQAALKFFDEAARLQAGIRNGSKPARTADGAGVPSPTR